MQYGLGDEVQRWGVAGFQGSPGWTVLRTAPFELLMQGHPPLLARLAARLGVLLELEHDLHLPRALPARG